MESLDGWVRGRLRGILRKRAGLRGRGRGKDHQKWPNHYFTKLGLYSLAAAQAEEKSLRKAVSPYQKINSMVPARPKSPSVLAVACGTSPVRSPREREATIRLITAFPSGVPSRPVS